MKLINILFLLIGLAACAPLKDSPRGERLAIENISVVDVVDGSIEQNQTILIQEGKIVAADLDSRVTIPGNYKVIDGQGKYLIPGLWDMHVHLEMAGKEALPLFVANGVTGVRDMGANSFDTLQMWRKSIEEGDLTGPHIVAAGPILDGPFFTKELRVTINTEKEARAAVDSLVKLGVDFIKVHQQISREAYLAAADQAKKHGVPLVGHRPNVITLQEAVEAGQKSVEHIFGIPDTTDFPYSALALNKVYVTPTLAFIDKIANYNTLSRTPDPRQNLLSDKLRAVWKEQTAAWGENVEKTVDMMGSLLPVMLARTHQLQNAGVDILAGTDLGTPYIYPGSSLHEELEMLVRAGFTPLEALQAATLNPARFFKKEETMGTVQKGKIADLVVLNSNPLESISNTKDIQLVIFTGKVISKK